MNIAAIKNFDPERVDVDEMIAISADARLLTAEYTFLNVKAPEWLDEKSAEIKRAVGNAFAAIKARRARELKARIATTLTAAEKRELYQKELAELEAS